MRVCVPLLAAAGLSGDDLPLAGHFGAAASFAVVDSDSGEILGECALTGACRGPCACPLPDLSAHRVEALAGPAAGYRLLQLSKRAGLPVYATRARTLGELRRELAATPPARLTAGVCLNNTRQRVAGRG